MSISSDDFDLDDLDDAALIAASQQPSRPTVNDSTKRKRGSIDVSQSKKLMSEVPTHPTKSPLAVRLL